MIYFRLKKHFYSSELIRFFVILLSLFLFIFPKGGIKIGSVPITWGYLLLGMTGFILAFRKTIRIQKNHLFVLAALTFFQIISALHFIINGIESIGFTISFVINFYLLPVIFFMIFSEYIKKIPLSLVLNIVKNGVLFLSVYGIFLFFFKAFTGKFIGIPLLTTNLGDSFSMSDKCISRGGIFKLISTYNNGNIFGVCMLMILPFYQHAERKTIRRLIVKLALLLTLSRTVWIGMIIHEIFDALMFSNNRMLKNLKLLTFFLGFGLLSVFIAKKINLNSSFFLDLSLGNRVKQFNAITEAWLFGSTAFRSITEITYMSILKNFGYMGLFSFCIAMFSPFVARLKVVTTVSNTIAAGLINYLIISFSDGTILYIPTLALYWFFASFMISNHDQAKISTFENLDRDRGKNVKLALH